MLIHLDNKINIMQNKGWVHKTYYNAINQLKWNKLALRCIFTYFRYLDTTFSFSILGQSKSEGSVIVTS